MSKPKSKRRHCPAVGREISSGECGENRISRYPCPASCAHNPFSPANYSRFLQLERAFDQRCIERHANLPAESRTSERAMREAMKKPTVELKHVLVTWDLFFRRDAAGLTCAERWEQSDLASFKNDERVLLRAKRQTRIALIEVHRVLDAERIEVVDLLDDAPTPFVVQDRSLASMAARFETLLGWAYPLPHYWRLSGSATLLPAMAQFEAKEVLLEIVRHLGGPEDEAGLRLWLAERYLDFGAALEATFLARRRQMLAGLDAQIGKAVYELTRPLAECRTVLDSHRAVSHDIPAEPETREKFSEARVWFDESEAAVQLGSGLPVLGRILLGETHWRVEAMGGARLTSLRQQLEKLMGKSLRFVSERRDDLSSQIASREAKYDEALVPPRLLENPEQLVFGSSRSAEPIDRRSIQELETEWLHEQDRAFLDQPIPALEGRTPRQAAQDPGLRPKLILILKHRVRQCDERNRERGLNHDMNWLLLELGTNEIVFDPPPPRSPRHPNNRIEEPDDDAFESPDLLPMSALPGRPLSLEEASERLRAGVGAFDTAKDAMSALGASGSTLVEDIFGITDEMLNEGETAFLLTFLLHTWFALVPPGVRGPQVESERLIDAVRRELQRIVEAVSEGSPQSLDRFLGSAAQPALTQLIVAEILDATTRGPKKSRPRVEAQPVIIAVVKAVIDEIDWALRYSSGR